MTFSLSSPAFEADGRIPDRFTCDERDVSPPLRWQNPPEGTRSFALLVIDPDAPDGPFYHWGVYDIPAEAKGLREQFLRMAGGAAHQAVNDFGTKGYGGPCPPKGDPPHHYHFRLFALGIEQIDIPENATCRELEPKLQAQKLAETEIVVTYSR